MEGEEVQLLGLWASPFVHRVEWVLKLKGITYELLEQDLTNKSPLLLKYNPAFKKVPVLVHHDNPICESLVIIEYIDETWKHNPILPHHTFDKAMARFWAQYIEDKLTESIRKTLFLEGEEQEKVVNEAKNALKLLEGELKDKKFFGGDTIGFVDIVLGYITIWLDVVEEVGCTQILDTNETPLIHKWMQRMIEWPEMKANAPPRNKLVLYFSNIRQFALAAEAPAANE